MLALCMLIWDSYTQRAGVIRPPMDVSYDGVVICPHYNSINGKKNKKQNKQKKNKTKLLLATKTVCCEDTVCVPIENNSCSTNLLTASLIFKGGFLT